MHFKCRFQKKIRRFHFAFAEDFSERNDLHVTKRDRWASCHYVLDVRTEPFRRSASSWPIVRTAVEHVVEKDFRLPTFRRSRTWPTFFFIPPGNDDNALVTNCQQPVQPKKLLSAVSLSGSTRNMQKWFGKQTRTQDTARGPRSLRVLSLLPPSLPFPSPTLSSSVFIY